MKELQQEIVKNLKGYTFNELKYLLNKNTMPEVREAILMAMETYHNKKYNEWLKSGKKCQKKY